MDLGAFQRDMTLKPNVKCLCLAIFAARLTVDSLVNRTQHNHVTNSKLITRFQLLHRDRLCLCSNSINLVASATPGEICFRSLILLIDGSEPLIIKDESNNQAPDHCDVSDREKSMRQQLDTALDSETKLRRKLMDQVPHRDRDRGSCRCNYALAETTTAKLTEIKPSNTQEELCHERVRVVELEAALASGREMLLDLEIREEKSRKQVDTEREVSVRLQTEVSEYKAELSALRAELDMKAYSLQELEVLREHRNKNRQQLESLHRRKLSLEQKLSALQQQQLTTQSSSRNVTPVDDIKQNQMEGLGSPISSSQQITTLSPALHTNEECLMTQLADAQRQLSALKNRLAAHDEELSLLTQELAISRQREAELERRVTPEGREPETSPLLKIGKVGHKGGTNTTVMCLQYKVSSFGSDQSLKEDKGISEVVSRLNKEKEELVNALKVLQDRDQSNAKNWADEKAALIRAVLAAEADVDNIHSQEMRDVGPTVTDMDERVAHLFGKYLRSESYRKALVWQKRYLLVVLGGYQECEALTLDRLAFLSGCSQDNSRTRSPKDKFRSKIECNLLSLSVNKLNKYWAPKEARVTLSPLRLVLPDPPLPFALSLEGIKAVEDQGSGLSQRSEGDPTT
uniref:Pericentrin/AKAP-450 centrosomal targeting domain-containing protein n=1 Tax=Timema bartmani TaxID=61472 RepID=A0A7R9EMY3_9NEOP|nr:unnamed protein product [Timema bartmani]